MSEKFDELDSSENLAPTSEESRGASEGPKRFQFGLFDSLLGVSLILVLISIALLFAELRNFGRFPSVFPWRTSEVLESGE